MKACIKKNYKNKFEGKNSLMSFAFDFDELGIRQRKNAAVNPFILPVLKKLQA